MVLWEDQEPVSATDNEKLRAHIAATANRLRMIQVDFADDSDQSRHEYLCEEIEHALKTVLPDERAEFLEGLKTKFPTVGDFGAQPIFRNMKPRNVPLWGRECSMTPGSSFNFLRKYSQHFPPMVRNLLSGVCGRAE